MLETIQALADARSQRGLYLYPDFASPPAFVPYSEFAARVSACADQFRAQGVERGERIIFPFETLESVIFSFFGLMEVGALPLSVKPYIISTPRQGYCEFLTRISERYQARRILDVPSLRGLDLPLARVQLPSSERAGGEHAPLRKVDPEEIAFVQFSSGSTSFPKGVPISHRNLIANLQVITGQGTFHPGDRGCSWLPLYHDMGLVGGLLSLVYAGCDSHLTAPASFLLDPMSWLEFMSSQRCTLGVIPNFAIDYALKFLDELDDDDLKDLDLSALRNVYLGSEPINIPNLERFTTRLAPRGLRRESMKACYGMAEAVLMVSCVGSQGATVVTGPNGQLAISVGKPLGGFETRLRAEDGRPCGERELGEIEIRGGSLVPSYYEDARPLRSEEGFYATGDQGFVQDGELFITGRISDRIKINGQSYFSSDFEQAVEQLPFVRAGRTVAVHINGRLVVMAEVQSPSVLKQRAHHQKLVCEQILNSVGVVVAEEDVLFIRYGQISKTSSGKLQRNAMSAAFREGRVRVATPLGLGTDLLRMRTQRLFYGSLLQIRKRGHRLVQSGRKVLTGPLQKSLKLRIRA
jgi:fatty-acyl-CoA synthase